MRGARDAGAPGIVTGPSTFLRMDGRSARADEARVGTRSRLRGSCRHNISNWSLDQALHLRKPPRGGEPEAEAARSWWMAPVERCAWCGRRAPAGDADGDDAPSGRGRSAMARDGGGVGVGVEVGVALVAEKGGRIGEDGRMPSSSGTPSASVEDVSPDSDREKR